MNAWHLRCAARTLRSGGIVAYPTEAVYGLGCDPWNQQAVLRLLEMKHRRQDKGLILIAGDWAFLQDFLLPLSPRLAAKLTSVWPGPMTWLLPARPNVPVWLRGNHDTLAVRVTAHPPAASLSRYSASALVSTSANVSGRPPARNSLSVQRVFGSSVDYILSGGVGNLTNPTPIYDGRTGKVVRAA